MFKDRQNGILVEEVNWLGSGVPEIELSETVQLVIGDDEF